MSPEFGRGLTEALAKYHTVRSKKNISNSQSQVACYRLSDSFAREKIKSESQRENRPFPSCFEPHYESEANKTNLRMESFALTLAFIMRFKATRKWPIDRAFASDFIL